MFGHAGSPTGIVHADMTLTRSNVKVKVTELLNFRKLAKPCMLAAMTVSPPCGAFWFSLLLERLERDGSGAGQKSGEQSGAVSGCEKKLAEAGLREVTERGVGLTEIGLSEERKFCHSRSARMLWCLHQTTKTAKIKTDDITCQHIDYIAMCW